MRFIYVVLLALLLPATVYAQCTNPPAAMGVIIFNKAHKVLQYCNGDTWIGLRGGGGSGLPTCSEGQNAKWTDEKWDCGDGLDVKGEAQQTSIAGPVSIPNVTARDMISLSVSTGGSYLVLGTVRMQVAVGYSYHSSSCTLQRNGSGIDSSTFYVGTTSGGSASSITHKLMALSNLSASDTIKINCSQSANGTSTGNNLKITLIPVKE